MTEGKKRARLTVKGDVQGVNFRYFAKDIARKMGITGWTDNNPDGSVELVVEGDSTRVDEFISWCQQGSPMSEVEEVVVEKERYKGEFKDFQIR